MPIGLDIKRIPQKNLVINGYQIPAEQNNMYIIQILQTLFSKRA
jgi:hypothetical protein